MDESVLKAMARWPDVPAVFGWLSLDRRGRWFLKDEPLLHPAVLAFIARNYAADEAGRWFFQNGPQRVFVALEAAPLVLRLEPAGGLLTHIDSDAGAVDRVLMDERGDVWLSTAAGPGLLDDRDLDAFSEYVRGAGGEPLDDDALIERVDALAAGEAVSLQVTLDGRTLPLVAVTFDDAPAQLGFVRDPEED